MYSACSYLKWKNDYETQQNNFFMAALGLLLGQASCTSNKHDDGISESMDSGSMDKTQTQMAPDSMMADSANSAKRPL